MKRSKLTQLPCQNVVWLDLSTVVCVRLESGEHGAMVVVHTSEGFAVPAAPNDDQSAAQLADAILALL